MGIQWSMRRTGGIYNCRKSVAAIKTRTAAQLTMTVLIVAAAIIASPLLLLSNGLNAQDQRSQGIRGTTFPPPVFGTIRSQPTYEINIPLSSENKAVFEPKEISIPTGMAVIWLPSTVLNNTRMIQI
jgi:hypothetical protein